MMGRLGAYGWSTAAGLVPKALKPMAASTYRWYTRHRDWSEIELDLLHLFVPRDKEAIDVGANDGVYTRSLSKLSRFVHAFEPDEETASKTEAIGCENVRVHRCALSANKGESTYRVPVIDGRPEVALGSLQSTGTAQVIERTVHTSTLDEFADRAIGFVKIDVEGHEIEVLAGGRVLFEKQKPVVMVEAQDQYRHNSVELTRNFFDRIGYHGIFVYGERGLHIDELTAVMTDSAQLKRPVSRKKMLYVNNFIFFPARSGADACISAINKHFER